MRIRRPALPPPPRPATPPRGAAGQAMIEFAVAILAVALICAGIVQFVELAGAKGDLLARVRGEAGLLALAATPAHRQTPTYIRDWREGEDAMRHTADDEATRASAALTLQHAILDRSARQADDWQYLDGVVNDELPTLRQVALPVTALGFLKVERHKKVELMPLMREWVYGKDHVTVGAEVWMPALRLEGFDR